MMRRNRRGSSMPSTEHQSSRVAAMRPVSSVSSGSQANRTEQHRHHGLHFGHVLRLKSLAVFQIQQPIVGETATRHVIDRGIAYEYPQSVLTGLDEVSHIDRVRRRPD